MDPTPRRRVLFESGHDPVGVRHVVSPPNDRATLTGRHSFAMGIELRLRVKKRLTVLQRSGLEGIIASKDL